MKPSHPLNLKQRDTFNAVRAKLPGIPASLANSSGIFLGKDYTHDLVRPGIAIYGGNPIAAACQSDACRGHLEGTILQTRDVARRRNRGLWRHLAGRRAKPASPCWVPATRMACPRALSSGNSNSPAAGLPRRPALPDHRPRLHGHDGHRRDRSAATPSPAATAPKSSAPILLIDEAADWAGTISYELLTRLGSRYARLYSGNSNSGPHSLNPLPTHRPCRACPPRGNWPRRHLHQGCARSRA